jgi:hypothetical protein
MPMSVRNDGIGSMKSQVQIPVSVTLHVVICVCTAGRFGLVRGVFYRPNHTANAAVHSRRRRRSNLDIRWKTVFWFTARNVFKHDNRKWFREILFVYSKGKHVKGIYVISIGHKVKFSNDAQ